jgi:hypothetical protein
MGQWQGDDAGAVEDSGGAMMTRPAERDSTRAVYLPLELCTLNQTAMSATCVCQTKLSPAEHALVLLCSQKLNNAAAKLIFGQPSNHKETNNG